MKQSQLGTELQREYQLRFAENQAQRRRVWKILVEEFFQPLIPAASTVLDLGCGWGEFINQVRAEKKYGMDLNPDGRTRLAPEVEFLEQDCSARWKLPDQKLDFVFTSNFFEHLPSKDALSSTLKEVRRCLKPGGAILCMGPNIRFLAGSYWDFWDHHLALSERSLGEILRMLDFDVVLSIDRFLPYTMVGKGESPGWQIRAYLRFPFVWRFFGKQFFVMAATRNVERPRADEANFQVTGQSGC